MSKQADYKLAGDVPEALKGKVIRLFEAETLDEVRTQVTNGDDKLVMALAQSALDIIRQRIARTTANSEDVVALLNEGDVDGAVRAIQDAVDAHEYGGRAGAAVVTKQVKQQAKQFGSVIEAAKNDPALAERLRAMGIEVPAGE